MMMDVQAMTSQIALPMKCWSSLRLTAKNGTALKLKKNSYEIDNHSFMLLGAKQHVVQISRFLEIDQV